MLTYIFFISKKKTFLRTKFNIYKPVMCDLSDFSNIDPITRKPFPFNICCWAFTDPCNS